MDPVSLPEWFTALAETSAVIVALFLPRYQEHRDRKASFARMRRVTTGMLEALAHDRATCKQGCDPLQLESAKDLELYLRVSFFALSDQRELALRDEVERLYRKLVAPEVDITAIKGEIAKL